MRTKAEFRAMMGMLGMGIDTIADELDVDMDEVYDWAYDDSVPIPDDVWDMFDHYRDLQMQVVTYALGKIDELAQEYGSYPSEVAIHQWGSQQAYNRNHDNEDDYLMANADNRLVAFALIERNIPFRWAEDDEEF